MSKPLHRQRASTPAKARYEAHELVRLAGEVFGELRDVTPRTPITAIERVSAPSTVDELEELAVDTRSLLRHEETGPIHKLTAAIERAGVCLVPIVSDERISGLSSWVDGVPVIGVNPNQPGDRFRLTLGHELAHLMFHTRPTDLTENEANRFAAALLFPLDDFEAALPDRPTLRDFVELKSTWGISVAASVYRAHEIDRIDDQRYRALQIQMSKWRKNEPARFDATHGTLFNRLIEVNGGVNDVARRLGVNASHVRRLTNWSHLRVV
ncbi:MAG: ImmA/IrrE family metallo-endopeptidase [Acidimicrobiales bacterium]